MVEVHIPVLSEDEDAKVKALLRYPSSTPHLNSFGLVICDKGLGAGRGVYATQSLAERTTVEVSPVLLFPPGEYDKYGKYTQLDGYTFVWKRTGGQKAVMALALGLGSLFNHSPQPNVTYTLDHATHSIYYRTIRSVAKGEELTISYGAGRMWWEGPPTQEALDLERNENLMASDPQAELSRFATVNLADSSDEEDVSAACTIPNGIELESRADSSHVTTTAKPARLDTSLYPPMYRITAAKDPTTLPLATRLAWAIDVDPRNASSAIKFVQRHPHELQNRDDGLYSTRHLRSFKTVAPLTSDSKRTKAGTKFLVCLQEAYQDRKALVDLLSSADAAGCFGALPAPYLTPVPRAPAPTRDRLAEWQLIWPCLVSSAASNNAPASSTTTGAGTWKLDVGAGQQVAVVDRKADQVMWQDELRLQWAANRFRRCVALARHAIAHSGEKDATNDDAATATKRRQKAISSAVHVTHPFDQAKTFLNQRRHGKTGEKGRSQLDWSWREREESSDWTSLYGDHAPVVGCIEHERSLQLSFLTASESEYHKHALNKTSLYISPVPGVGTIEVDAVDQRIAKRNPLKHAAVEAIARVSILRTIDRTSETSASASSGSDYLLTGLVMFCLYEPCVYCTMALLHSRVREVYFLLPSPGSGGCCGSQLSDLHSCDAGADGGIYALQEQKGLNHAFTVWRWMHPILSHPANPAQAEDVSALQRELSIFPLDP